MSLVANRVPKKQPKRSLDHTDEEIARLSADPSWNSPPEVEEPNHVWLSASVEGTPNAAYCVVVGKFRFDLPPSLLEQLVKSAAADGEDIFRAIAEERFVECMISVDPGASRILEVDGPVIQSRTTETTTTRAKTPVVAKPDESPV